MASQPKPPYTAIELWTPEGPVYRRASTAPPRPAAPEEIPIVDLKGMGFTAAEKAEIVSAIKTAATAYGFFYVKNHGIPDEVVANALTQSKAFFSQSDEEKMLASSRKNPLRHGYSPVGRGQINRSEPRGLIHSTTPRRILSVLMGNCRRKRKLPVPLPAEIRPALCRRQGAT